MATSLFPSATAAVEPPFLEWRTRLVRQRWRQVATGGTIALLVAITAWRCQVNLASFLLGIDKGVPIFGLFFPPDWASLPSMLKPMLVTLVLAMIATILGIVLSVPCALGASSNLAPTPIRLILRFFIALERGLPEVVQILILVAVFGLGVIPALIALSLSSIGMLAKLLADAIEEIDPNMLEAVAGTGATTIQVIRYAIIPHILPALLANGLFRFEFNVRAGVILGAIGGGGIGYIMRSDMLTLDYQAACMATLLTLAMVFATERLSDFLRARILDGGQMRRGRQRRSIAGAAAQ